MVPHDFHSSSTDLFNWATFSLGAGHSEIISVRTVGKLASVCDDQAWGVLCMMEVTTSFNHPEPFCSRPPMWTALARVRMTTLFNSSLSPYNVEAFKVPDWG